MFFSDHNCPPKSRVSRMLRERGPSYACVTLCDCLYRQQSANQIWSRQNWLVTVPVQHGVHLKVHVWFDSQRESWWPPRGGGYFLSGRSCLTPATQGWIFLDIAFISTWLTRVYLPQAFNFVNLTEFIIPILTNNSPCHKVENETFFTL